MRHFSILYGIHIIIDSLTADTGLAMIADSSYHVMIQYATNEVHHTLTHREHEHMAQSPQLDRRIIHRAQQGDAEAVTQLYQTYVERIHRYIAVRVNNTADAEDLTAEVFVTMVEGLSSYRDTGAPFEAWLYRIAYARIIDHRRRQNRRQHDMISEDMQSDTPQPEQTIVAEQEYAKIRAALAQLSDDDQTILILRFVERKSHQEVADTLNKTVTAVKSAQHRALTRLAKILGEEKTRHYLRGDSSNS